LTALALIALSPTFFESLDCVCGSPNIGGVYLPQPYPKGLVSRRGDEGLLPSAQARRGDEDLDRARSLRDQFREVIPNDGMVSLQNRITMYV